MGGGTGNVAGVIRLRAGDLEVGKLVEGEPIVEVDKKRMTLRTLDSGINKEVRINCYYFKINGKNATLLYNGHTEVFPGEECYDELKRKLDNSPRGLT